MATRKQLAARCSALGAELLDDDGTILVLCPVGILFSGPRLHMIRLAWNHPPGAWKKSDAYDALLVDLKMGTEACIEPDCDYCAEENP